MLIETLKRFLVIIGGQLDTLGALHIVEAAFGSKN